MSDLDPEALSLWSGFASMYRDDWETIGPADLWDGRHEHREATHANAVYPDPANCELCFDGAVWVIEFHRDRRLMAAAHAARNARVDGERSGAPRPRPATAGPTREEMLDLRGSVRRAFAGLKADYPEDAAFHFVPSEDHAFFVAKRLLEDGWSRAIARPDSP